MGSNIKSKLYAFELTKRLNSQTTEKLTISLMDAQVDLNPHQIEAALFALKSPLSKGALLADEVGLGKTIEAGILLSQKWAERKRKILIITPANLRKQWSQELQDKFFLPSIILETSSFNTNTKNKNFNPFVQNTIIITSFQFASSKNSYINSIEWDLVVIDEAHRLRNVYKKQNKIANNIKTAIEKANKKILLTATPLQNSLLELYGLVSLIDDYAFGDLKSFKSQYSKLISDDSFDELKARLKPLCQRTLRKQTLNINFTKRICLTEEFYPHADEQKLYDEVSEYLRSDTLYALPASQRALMTLVLRKLLASSSFAISNTLKALVEKLNTLSKSNNTSDNNLQKVISEDIENIDELEDELKEQNEIEIEEIEQIELSKEEINEIIKEKNILEKLQKLAESIKINAKGEKLLTAIEKGFEKSKELATNQEYKPKALIFTESTRTQEYIKNILENSQFKDKIVLFNGSNTDLKSKLIYKNWIQKNKGNSKVTGSKTADMRAALVDYFKEEAQIMIATEAAAEGMNLQFCSLIVNYDLPWNPQRIEQRIGRCHRYGQIHDVVVVNFLNKKNEADQRVYELLKEKFKLFDGVFGASDEILGNIESGIDFQKRIADIYQKCRSIEEINNSFEELNQIIQPQIDTEIKKTRQSLLENFDAEVHDKLKITLDESKRFISKYENWLWEITKYSLDKRAVFCEENKTFELIEEPENLKDILKGTYKLGKPNENYFVYRMGHPLAEHIISKCKKQEIPTQEIIFDLSNHKPKIAVLKNLKGKSGWLQVRQLTINSLETEDFLICIGLADNNEELEEEQVRRIIELAILDQKEYSEDLSVLKILENLKEKRQKEILQLTNKQNAELLDKEMDKLDKWAEDQRNALKIILKDFDEQIKECKKQARLAPNLPEKLKLEKERKKIETERDRSWKEYDNSAKEIEKQKDLLIDNIEESMKQRIVTQILFTIKWSLA